MWREGPVSIYPVMFRIKMLKFCDHEISLFYTFSQKSKIQQDKNHVSCVTFSFSNIVDFFSWQIRISILDLLNFRGFGSLKKIK